MAISLLPSFVATVDGFASRLQSVAFRATYLRVAVVCCRKYLGSPANVGGGNRKYRKYRKYRGYRALHPQLILLRRLFLLAARHSANKFALCSRSAASVIN